MIVAISGLKYSGKDTVADYLVNNYGFVRYAFADPIKEICKTVFEWSDDFLKNHKEEVDSYWGISPRQAFQWIGTEVFQFYISNDFPEFFNITGRRVWVRKFIRWYYNSGYKNVVISDVRFFHELFELEEYFKDELISVRINRKDVEPNDPHASEQDIPKLEVDYEVDNNGTLEELYEQMDFLLNISKIS